SSFSFLRDRVWDKIKGWQSKLLSMAGKEVLIKAILQAVPVYAMQIFRLPRRVLSDLERLFSNFWWHERQNRRFHWAKWKKICQPKALGGMGFKELDHFNKSLLAKQAWRLLKFPERLPSRIIKAKYYPNCSFEEAQLGRRPSFTWRSIFSVKTLVQNGSRWRIGDGRSINIWNDRWLSAYPISRPRINNHEGGIPTTVADIRTGQQGWNVELIRQTFSPKETSMILPLPLSDISASDELYWHPTTSGLFTVKS
ncbi:hypothetical protein M569_09277, partial [Genlisea aurea]